MGKRKNREKKQQQHSHRDKYAGSPAGIPDRGRRQSFDEPPPPDARAEAPAGDAGRRPRAGER
ncbi:hypothetical protein [Streptomyces sp. CMB-StM0423]|uniref:hypothetical protein n=1 Tax=Streptomyces sp. CMB-StM0423 TaxID=2059884 RepID=UPI000C7018F6|nr:hypothetical protein [Streptomyces sp. CMB-StM0423]AUH43530.1 hypothetical protein CXR04_28170 [Streptomyces sp. CMB-StM0423]